MPAETHVERGELDRRQVFELIRDRLADILEIDPSGLSRRLRRGFRDGELLARAVAHRSWCAETPGTRSNERLEFLGDAVLGLVVTDHIYRTYADLPEGELAKVRAAVVNAGALAELA